MQAKNREQKKKPHLIWISSMRINRTWKICGKMHVSKFSICLSKNSIEMPMRKSVDSFNYSLDALKKNIIKKIVNLACIHIFI